MRGSVRNPFGGRHIPNFDFLAPLLEKGDIIVHDGERALRLTIGADNQVLTADSTAEVGLKWKASSGSGVTIFLGLSDTPSSYSGESLKYVRVNTGETALEFADAPVTSVNGATGAVVLDTDDINEGITNKYYPGLLRTMLLMGG